MCHCSGLWHHTADTTAGSKGFKGALNMNRVVHTSSGNVTLPPHLWATEMMKDDVFCNPPVSYMIHQMLLVHVAPLANCVEEGLPQGSQVYLKPSTEDVYWLHLLNLHKQILIVINLNTKYDEYSNFIVQKNWTVYFKILKRILHLLL